MNRWPLRVVALWQIMGSAVFGGDPFSVDVKVQNTETGRVLAVAFSIPEHYHLYAEQIKVEPVGALELTPLYVPPALQTKDPFSDAVVGVYGRDVTFTYGLHGDTTVGTAVKVKYQGCSETECFFPVTKTFPLAPTGHVEGGKSRKPQQEKSEGPTLDWRSASRDFTVVGRATGYMGPAPFLRFLDDAEAGLGTDQDKLQTLFARKGAWIWVAVVLIVLGGLGLNLTPCVLPMIPINIAIIGAGSQAGSRMRGLALGATYGAGIALAYGGLGLFVVLTGAKFGALNSSSVFNAVVALIFLILSLGMFDIIAIDFSRFQGTGTPGAKRGSFAVAFLMGAVSALLAGACVAPVVVSVLLLATELYRGSHTVGLLLPFLLGLGMALPWPLAGAGLSLLPKPGRWMEAVKRGFGVIILLMAGWYGYMSISLAHYRTAPHRAETVQVQTRAAEQGEWTTSLDEALARSRREQRLLIVDFWASWCKNCLTMDETTFKNADVRRRLEPLVRLKFQAEDLNDPAVRTVLDRFGVVGLPTYVILTPPLVDKGGRESGGTAR